jgi:hypothetical protein
MARGLAPLLIDLYLDLRLVPRGSGSPSIRIPKDLDPRDSQWFPLSGPSPLAQGSLFVRHRARESDTLRSGATSPIAVLCQVAGPRHPELRRSLRPTGTRLRQCE